jgi:Neuraminidase (sialidase)
MRIGKRAAMLATAIAVATLLPAAASPSRPARMGYRAGDDWEPSIAADRLGHVYVFWTHYTPQGGKPDPACRRCASPHMDLQISSDGGATWSAPVVPFRSTIRQDDPQVVVDPVDGRTVYASYMQGSKSSQYVARSTDFGKTWTTVLVEHLQRGTDKDVLAVRGDDIYLVYNAVMKIDASVSHDGGRTWHLRRIVSNTNSALGWSLPGGGVIDSKGNAYFSWEGYTHNGKPSGPVNIFVSKSTNGGRTWTVHRLDVSQAPPQCSTCGWAFWGPGTSMAADANDALYVLYNANSAKFAPNRMYLAVSTDGGRTWTRQDVSLAPLGANQAFPAVVARGDGDVRVAWMDDREGHDDGSGDGTARWNVYYRTSTDGGASWSPETILSRYVSGYGYELLHGFNEPYGDYMEMDVDDSGSTQAAWGEGPSYQGPGNVWSGRI